MVIETIIYDARNMPIIRSMNQLHTYISQRFRHERFPAVYISPLRFHALQSCGTRRQYRKHGFARHRKRAKDCPDTNLLSFGQPGHGEPKVAGHDRRAQILILYEGWVGWRLCQSFMHANVPLAQADRCPGLPISYHTKHMAPE
jgi:hypothetical protein